MKKLFTVVLLLSSISLTTRAQEWLHGKKGIYSVGIGGTQGIGVGSKFQDGYTSGYGFTATPLTYLGLSIHGSGEYKVHKFIGLGWYAALDFILPPDVFGYASTGGAYYFAKSLGIPLGARANFHILEATSAKIKDKLDVYAGLSFAVGPGFFIDSRLDAYPTSDKVFAIIHAGPQVGLRYWPSKKVGIYLEGGWGTNFIAGGVSF